MSEELISRDDIVGLIGERVSDDAWAERSVAAIERAAAEKAWDEGANAVTCEWRLHPERGDAIVKHAQVRTRRPANPYRKEHGND